MNISFWIFIKKKIILKFWKLTGVERRERKKKREIALQRLEWIMNSIINGKNELDICCGNTKQPCFNPKLLSWNSLQITTNNFVNPTTTETGKTQLNFFIFIFVSFLFLFFSAFRVLQIKMRMMLLMWKVGQKNVCWNKCATNSAFFLFFSSLFVLRYGDRKRGSERQIEIRNWQDHLSLNCKMSNL